ncbi:hypothetical protein [Croceivirga thetidis]|uniref:Adhesin domain-containing protein n=1 Tax=Croceivirga thetidis TaxID=2721623 RepID=A0ABX1GLZ5_9FLAO|nr:hypothetical protein [Croceivirga thetidis]NKI30916.1 hypothetical protein [Croceivirga thetidis]
MKIYSTIIIFLLMTLVTQGQKIIEKTLVSNGKSIELDVKFARNIEVKTWDKQSVYFKATIEIKDDQFIDKYKVDIDETNSRIKITEVAEPVFKAFREYGEKQGGDNLRYWYNSGDLCKFSYVLYVPENAEFEVKSINGSLSSDEIVGYFRAELINGDIDIKKYSGRLQLSTINGAIDLVVANNQFVAETIHGDIYADDNVKFKAHDRHVGHHIESIAQNTSTKLKLNTINGNMYLR